MGNLKLMSSDFEDGGEIPRECGYKNGNKEPTLAISGLPGETESLALIMDDPDALKPAGKVWVHWVLWDIMASDGPLSNSFQVCKWGMTDFGKLGYGGPAPPDKRHTYVFKLYALDCKVLPCIGGKATKPEVETAMEGYIIEQAILKGTYAP